MKTTKILLIGGLLLLGWLCPSVYARSIPGAPNEVEDPWFIDYVETGADTWYVEGNNYTFTSGGPAPGSYYFDPGRSPGDQALVRTIVDDYEGLWNPDYSAKEIDFFLYTHLDGDGYISVRFDWWNDEGIPEPPNNPNEGLLPDGYTDWYTLTAADSGQFENGSNLVGPDEEPGIFTPYVFHDIWDHQPRWVSIEILAGNDPNSTVGGEALFTGVDFEARCVPEPVTLLLLLTGCFGLYIRRGK
jgi:hypothetical protein